MTINISRCRTSKKEKNGNLLHSARRLFIARYRPIRPARRAAARTIRNVTQGVSERISPDLYSQLLLSERLYPLCREVDEAAENRLRAIADREQAHEVILAELVYC
jgi:hypothetical protein